MKRQTTWVSRRDRWALALVPAALALALAACGSNGGAGSGGGGVGSAATSGTPSLKIADKTVQSAMTSYLAAVSGSATQSNPVVCLEAADHMLGDKIHTYANLLAGNHAFSAPKTELTTTLNAAQTLANSLEILGDAQPTQANYDQVLNTFNVSAAISQLQGDVTTLVASLGR